MMRNSLGVSLIIFLLVFTGCASEQSKIFREVSLKTHSAITPVKSGYWEEWNHEIESRLAQGNVDLIFLGDSITHFWQGTWDYTTGSEIWQQYYTSRNAVNMGVAGERTQHVLWRIEYGNIGNTSAKVVVLMIGTNNNDVNTAEEIGDGIIAICAKLRQKLPKTKILILAIFPSGREPGPHREKNAKASLLAYKIADGRMIHYMDINDRFLTDDGILTTDIMPDGLHPNANGYKIWAQAIELKLMELLE
ncbi:GDSL-type esterase/lipase family protein [Planctomycetota bacterium]